MRFFSQETFFPYSWREATIAFWRRYPNAYSKHVVSEDVAYRAIESGRLRTVRVLCKTAIMPRWGVRFFGNFDRTLVVEESIVDLVERTVTTYTRNIDFLTKSIMSTEEKCTIRPCRDGRTTSVLRQAWITAYVRGLVHVLERSFCEYFKHKAANADKGYLMTMERMYGPSKVPTPITKAPGMAAKLKSHLHRP